MHTYRFPRSHRHVLVAGLTAVDVAVCCAVTAFAFGTAWVLSAALSAAVGAAAGLSVALAGAGLLLPWRGRKVYGWLSWIGVFRLRQLLGQTAYNAAPGHGGWLAVVDIASPSTEPDLDAVEAELPAVDRGRKGAKRKGAKRKGEQAGQPESGEAVDLDLPGALFGMRLHALAAPALRSGHPIAAVGVPREGALTAICAVTAPPMLLSTPDEQDHLTVAWGDVLAQACRMDASVSRLQVVDLTEPGGDAAVAQWHRANTVMPPPGAALSSAVRDYAALREQIAAGRVHRTLVAVTVTSGSTRSARKASGGSIYDVLVSECASIGKSLANAGIEVVEWLTPDAVARLLRDAYDPTGAMTLRGSTAPLSPCSVGPVATRTSWGHVLHDSAMSCTLWAALWPADPVRSTLLADLMLLPGVNRRITLTYRPVPTAAIRQKVRGRRNADQASQLAKMDRGAVITADDVLQAEDSARTEAELAHGAGAARWALYVTATADSLDELENAVGALQRCALSRDVDLRRVYGAQDDAFTWTLPLGRGLGRS